MSVSAHFVHNRVSVQPGLLSHVAPCSHHHCPVNELRATPHDFKLQIIFLSDADQRNRVKVHKHPDCWMVVIMWCLEPSYQHALLCVHWASFVACFVQLAVCVLWTSCSFSVEDTDTKQKQEVISVFQCLPTRCLEEGLRWGWLRHCREGGETKILGWTSRTGIIRNISHVKQILVKQLHTFLSIKHDHLKQKKWIMFLNRCFLQHKHMNVKLETAQTLTLGIKCGAWMI